MSPVAAKSILHRPSDASIYDFLIDPAVKAKEAGSGIVPDMISGEVRTNA